MGLGGLVIAHKREMAMVGLGVVTKSNRNAGLSSVGLTTSNYGYHSQRAVYRKRLGSRL